MKIHTNFGTEQNAILKELDELYHTPIYIEAILHKSVYFKKYNKLCYINNRGVDWVVIREIIGSFTEKLKLNSIVYITGEDDTDFVTKYRRYKITQHPP